MASVRKLRDAEGLTVVVYVQVTREWKLRRFIAKWLFALAALVLRCEIRMVDDD